MAPGTPLDFMASLILGDMGDNLIWAMAPAAQFVIAVGTLPLPHVTVSLVACHHPSARQLAQGNPVTVLRSGRLEGNALRRERRTEADVHAMPRERNLDDLCEVENGTLEGSGKPEICRRLWVREARKRDRSRALRLLRGGKR